MSDTVITTNVKVSRRLRGATFLSLEHALKAGLIVIVTVLIGMAVGLAFQLWTGTAPDHSMSLFGNSGAGLAVGAAMTVAASLLVLVPTLLVLEMRTRAEYLKRPGFKNRLAYKLPLYAAFAVLLVLVTAGLIQLLAAFLSSLALIGARGINIGSIYTSQFLPALFSTALYTVGAYYLFQVIRGRSKVALYGLVTAVVAAVLVLALFVTSLVVAHDNTSTTSPTEDQTLEDYFRNYNSNGFPY